MSRKMKIRTDHPDDEPASESWLDDTDPHGFWDGASLDDADNDDAFAEVIDIAGDLPDERETLVYMGRVTEVSSIELATLGTWAEGKACRGCKRKMRTRGDLLLLKHEECRTAFRVSNLLHRYQ